MASDPFTVLARAVAGKSDLRLTQVQVVSVEATTATVTYRGASVAGVPWTGATPTADTVRWMLVDPGAMVLLT